jgi:hypothetical protein
MRLGDHSKVRNLGRIYFGKINRKLMMQSCSMNGYQ